MSSAIATAAAHVRFCPPLSAPENPDTRTSEASLPTPPPSRSPTTSCLRASVPSSLDDAPPAPDDAFIRDEEPESIDFNIYDLTPNQHRAIDLLLAGYTVLQVAEALHVSDRTIRRWKKAQPEFIAEYNRRVAEHSSICSGRLRGLVDIAVVHIEKIFQGDNERLKTSAALRILSTLVSKNLAHHHGPTTHQEVLAEFVKQRLRAYNEDDKTPLTTSMCDDYLAEITEFLAKEAKKDEAEPQQPQSQPSEATPMERGGNAAALTSPPNAPSPHDVRICPPLSASENPDTRTSEASLPTPSPSPSPTTSCLRASVPPSLPPNVHICPPLPASTQPGTISTTSDSQARFRASGLEANASTAGGEA